MADGNVTPAKRQKQEENEQPPEIPLINKHFAVLRNHFNIVRQIGEGTFSKVYLANYTSKPNKKFALKYLVPTSAPERIEKELKCLTHLGGDKNVLGVEVTLRHDDHVIFILPYFPHQKFTDSFHLMSVSDVREYMFHLFTALAHVHKFNVIHRDVKPSNFLYSTEHKRYALIDFGLAMQIPGTKGILSEDNCGCDEFGTAYQPALDGRMNKQMRHSSKAGSSMDAQKQRSKSFGGTKSTRAAGVSQCPSQHKFSQVCHCCKNRARQVSPRAGTPGFRSPEVLLKYTHQDAAVDIWSTGVILLCILTARYPFFKAMDDMNALAQLIVLFGSRKMAAMAASIGKDILISPPVEGQTNLSHVCRSLNRRRCKLHKYQSSQRTSLSSSSGAAKSVFSNNCAAPQTGSLAVAGVNQNQLNGKRKRNSLHGDKEEIAISIEELDQRPPVKRPSVSRSPSKKLRESPRKIIVQTIHGLETGEKENEKNDGKGEKNNAEGGGECTCFPESVYVLLKGCLTLDPKRRMTAKEALETDFLKQTS